MIKQLLSTQSHSITGAAVLLGAASFVSRLIGVLRDRVFAHYFGAGDVLDAYYAAFRIPDLVYNLLIVGALSAGFIPVFIEVLHKDEEKAGKLVDSVITILGIVLIVVCGVLFFATPALMKALTPGFEADKLQLATMLTRIMFLSPILLGVSSVMSGILQAFKNFFVYSLTPIMYNLGIIIGTLILVPLIGLSGLAWGVVIGAALHLAIQIPSLIRHGFRYRPSLRWSAYVKRIAILMTPRTLGLAANQINLIVITTLASTLAVGSITVFNFANNLQYFPIGIIGLSFSIAAFPTLAQFAAEMRTREMIDQLSLTIRQIIFLIVPVTIIFLLLRAQIVRVVLGTGAFDWDATVLTANTLAFFSFSLFAQSLIPLLARSLYALQDTWTPFVISLSAAFINIIMSFYFKTYWGVLGLALAFSLSMIVQLVLLWLTVRKQLGTLKELTLLHSLYKISVSALIMAIVIQMLKEPIASFVDMTRFWGILTQGMIAALGGLFVYGALCRIFKVEEMLLFQKSLARRWVKLWHVETDVKEVHEHGTSV